MPSSPCSCFKKVHCTQHHNNTSCWLILQVPRHPLAMQLRKKNNHPSNFPFYVQQKYQSDVMQVTASDKRDVLAHSRTPLTVHWSHVLPMKPKLHGHMPLTLLQTKLMLPTGSQLQAKARGTHKNVDPARHEWNIIRKSWITRPYMPQPVKQAEIKLESRTNVRLFFSKSRPLKLFHLLKIQTKWKTKFDIVATRNFMLGNPLWFFHLHTRT